MGKFVSNVFGCPIDLWITSGGKVVKIWYYFGTFYNELSINSSAKSKHNKTIMIIYNRVLIVP